MQKRCSSNIYAVKNIGGIMSKKLFADFKPNYIKWYHYTFLWMFPKHITIDGDTYLVSTKAFGKLYVLKEGKLNYHIGVDPAINEKE